MTRLFVFALVFSLSGVAPLFAQTPTEIVARNRARFGPTVSPPEAPLLLRSIAADLTQTLGQPYGILPKTAGNVCGGYACDIICNAQFHWDVLNDGPDGEKNLPGLSGPDWQARGAVPRACEFVSGPPVVTPPVDPPPPPALVIDYDRIAAIVKADGDLTRAQVDQPGWLTRFLSNRYVQMVGAAASVCAATRCWEHWTQPQAAQP